MADVEALVEGLKSCPFCNKTYVITGYGAGNRAKLQCTACEATGPIGRDGEKSAIAAWNRRALLSPDLTPEDLLDAMAEAIVEQDETLSLSDGKLWIGEVGFDAQVVLDQLAKRQSGGKP